MKKSYLMIAISMTLVQGCYTAPPYEPSSRVAVGYSGVNIGIHYSTYPDLVRIPGYPVYYAPRVDSNFFFYDGLYWVFHSDNWYVSSWYNGPWDYVGYYDVPAYLLRVPVRYYRQPPPYFRGWRADAPPRWGDHWGPRLGTASKRVGPLGPRLGPGSCTVAGLPAELFGRTLSSRSRTAAYDTVRELPLPAA